MNFLLISSLPHVRDWARAAAAQDIRGRDGVVHEVRHVEAGNSLLRARDDIDLVLLVRIPFDPGRRSAVMADSIPR